MANNTGVSNPHSGRLVSDLDLQVMSPTTEVSVVGNGTQSNEQTGFGPVRDGARREASQNAAGP